MSVRLTIHGISEEPFDVLLDDVRYAALRTICDRRGLTIEEAVQLAFDEFMEDLFDETLIAKAREFSK